MRYLKDNLTKKIEQNKKLKSFVHNCLMHPVKTRPRLWVRMLQPLYIKRGKRAVIYSSVRRDLVPFRNFRLGDYSVVESFSVLNNAVGDVCIGNHSRIGIGNTIIGPIQIGNHVNIAQGVVLSGLNHNYDDATRNISDQGVSVSSITINDDVWIGANVCVLAGITVGKHVVIGAGSVVTKNIPDYCIAIGNPARVVKRYDLEKGKWVKE
mgnify:CR=1 FL=1